MSDKDTKAGAHKTLAIRLDPQMHAQLQVIAQLRGSTITDEIRQAIEAHLDVQRSAEDLAAQASTALEEIDREAEARRGAIATLFGGDKPPGNKPARRSNTR